MLHMGLIVFKLQIIDLFERKKERKKEMINRWMSWVLIFWYSLLDIHSIGSFKCFVAMLLESRMYNKLNWYCFRVRGMGSVIFDYGPQILCFFLMRLMYHLRFWFGLWSDQPVRVRVEDVVWFDDGDDDDDDNDNEFS